MISILSGCSRCTQSVICRTADQIWNVYLGGALVNRPFGAAVLDGVDLDIEHFTPYYPDFVVQLNSTSHIAAECHSSVFSLSRDICMIHAAWGTG